MLGFMGRVLVQATLPHSRTNARQFVRSNGGITVHITALGEHALPFGSYPRLLLTWLCTEAAREKSPIIELGDSLSEFMRKLGLLPTGGRWGTIPRFKEAAVSLFSSAVSYVDRRQPGHEHRAQMLVADELDLWWIPNDPEQTALWRSTLTLSDRFFRAVTERPVPIDLRAIGVLKQSSMALDLYCWATYRVSYLTRETTIPWELLRLQFGAEYADTKQGRHRFKAKLLEALRRVCTVYGALRLKEGDSGLTLLPSPPHVRRVARKNAGRLL